MATVKFCRNCGAPLTPGDRFCGSCGQDVGGMVAGAASVAGASSAPPPPSVSNAPPSPMSQAAPPPFQAAPPPAYPGEPLVGIIPAVSRRKGLGTEGYNIIVTQRRMIFAVMTNDMIKEESKRVSQGKGFLGGIAAAATVGNTFYKRYLNMSPDDALAENRENFAVDLSRIRRVKITAGKENDNYFTIKENQNNPIQHHTYEQSRLEIETVGDTYKFDLPGSSVGMALDVVRRAGLG